jgi:hypothetical protein
MKPRISDARLQASSPNKEHSARALGEAYELPGKKGSKVPKKLPSASSSPTTRIYQSEPVQLPSAKKEGHDSPKRKWFGIKKKATANKEAKDREKGGTLE